MAALFLLTALVGGALAEFADVEETKERTRQRAEEVAALLEGHVAATHTATDALIMRVADMVQRSGFAAVQSRAYFDQLHQAVEAIPQVKAVWVADANGNLVFSSSRFPAPVFNVSARPYFMALKDGGKQQWSPLFRSSFYDEIVSVDAHRMTKADGGFAGLVAASIDSGYFNRAVHGGHLGPLSELAVFRLDGALVAADPLSEDVLANTWSNHPLFTAARATPVGTYEGPSPLARVPSTVSYRVIDNLPLLVVSSIPNDEAFADLWHRRLRRLGLAAFALAGMAALTILALRAVARHEQASAEAHRNSQWLKQALASSPTALVELDCDLRYRSVVNAQVPAAEAAAGKRVGDLFEPESAEFLERFYREVLESRQPMSVALVLRPLGGGKEVHFETHAQPDYDESGRLRGVRASSQNISFLVKLTRDLLATSADKEVLFKEVHHRVENNLQIVANLLTVQSLQAEDPQVREGLADILDRISSMALVHTLLYRHDNATRVHIPNLLSALCETLAVSHGAPERNIQIEVQADDQRIALEKAVPVALIANEAITNALKHAFPEDRPGHIRVTFRAGQGRCLLRVADDGIGSSPDKFRSGSIGMMLIRGLAEQLDGRSRFEQGAGTTFELAFSV